MPPRRLDVLGVSVTEITEGEVLALVDSWVELEKHAHIVTVNAEYIMLARRDEQFARVLRDADLATPDGAGVVWAMRRQGSVQRERVGGSDLIWSISGQAAQKGYSVFLLGGGPGVAPAAADALSRRYPELRVAGTVSGSPKLEEEAPIVHLIRQSNPDILFVAFGAPYQDLWIARNLDAMGVSVAMGVGGSFDYLAGTARRAPAWMREHGLEWLWRLLRQPRRWRRMLALPEFACLVWREGRGEKLDERETSDTARD